MTSSLWPLIYLIISCVWSKEVRVHCLYANELHPHRNVVLSLVSVETLSHYVNMTKVEHFSRIKAALTLRKAPFCCL